MTSDKRQAARAGQRSMHPFYPDPSLVPNGSGRKLGRPLSELKTLALFLDIDGTLLDLAATPDQVRVEPGLADVLYRLETQLGGALALVTGRAVDFVDRLFPMHCFTVAGLHGAELRPGPQAAALRPVRAVQDGPAFAAALNFMHRAAAQHAGLLPEIKGAAFALHYRRAPELRPDAEGIMAEALRIAGPAYDLRNGKYVVELGPAGSDKGAALRNIMAIAPFKGRRPIAAGDDLTDEAMFLAVNEMGGVSIRIGDRLAPSKAMARLESPADLRDWLHGLAGALQQVDTNT